jgi:hypothetical protein
MFCYCSVLVELDVFKEIHVNFLVVGHTHGKDDREFSVLSNAIEKYESILSPLSTVNLFEKTHKNATNGMYVNSKVNVIYDYKTLF